MPTRTLGPEGGWIMVSHIGWGGEQNTILVKEENKTPFWLERRTKHPFHFSDEG